MSRTARRSTDNCP